MFSKRLNDIVHSLAFRLTLWYALIFAVTALFAFTFFYFLITTVIERETDQDLLNQMRKFSSLLAVEGIDSVRRVAIVESQAGGERKIFFRVLSRSGETFLSSNMSYWQDIDVDREAIARLAKKGEPVFVTQPLPRRKHAVRILYGMIGAGVVLQVGRSLEEYGRFILLFKRVFVGSMTILIISAALIGWFMARGALSGVETVTRTAKAISSQDALAMRVPVKSRNDEIDELAQTFNAMLERIEQLVTGIKDMSDNVAHDLRSPLTRIRGIAEVTLSSNPTGEEYEHMAASIVEECDRLLAMINATLMISRLETGVEMIDGTDMDLSAVVRGACELFHPAAEDKGVDLSWQLPDTFAYNGDVGQIQRMISNIIDNAVKYTPPGGSVSVSLHDEDADAVSLSVTDTGVGIDCDDLSRIFERFYRCDRSRSESGAGLGLSLARTIARAHGGDITVFSTPESGSTFTVTLARRNITTL